MVRLRTYSAIPSRFSNRYIGQDSQTAGGGGDSGQGESIGDDVLENVLNFEYLCSRLQCDGDDQVDVGHRSGCIRLIESPMV